MKTRIDFCEWDVSHGCTHVTMLPCYGLGDQQEMVVFVFVIFFLVTLFLLSVQFCILPVTRHSSPLLPLMIKCLEQCSYWNSLVGHKLNSWNPLITFTNSCYGICILYSTSKANTFYVLQVQAVTGNSWRPQQPVSAVTMHAKFMELCIALVKFIYIGLHRASSGQTGVRIVGACIAIFPPGWAREETESWRQGHIAGV